MNEILIPNNSVHDVASYQILIDDQAVDASFQVLSISLLNEVNRIPSAKIVFRDGEAAEKNFSLSNNDLFIPGKNIKIKFGRDADNTQLFKGVITKHAIKVKANGITEFHLECKHETIRMSLERHSKYFENLTDTDLFNNILGNYKISADVQNSGLKHAEIVQHFISDWDFLVLRAEANGMLVHVFDERVKIAKPDTSGSPVVQVTFGSSILEFDAEIDARNQWKSVNASAWDYKNQQLFNTNSVPAKLTEAGNISGDTLANALNVDFEFKHSGHLLEQELQTWADGAMIRSRLSKIKGRVKITGFSGVKPGDMIKLSGVGDRFNGNVYVTATRHDMGQGIWETQIQFGLHQEYHAQLHKDIADAPSEGLVGAINGLQVGKVVQLQSDPNGEDRILVRIPTIDKDAQGIWTRVATLDAGKERGSFFLPEIDDEVIVGFINDDPRHAVMLGMLHSSAKAAPIVAEDANDKKGFTTRSKMHLSFNDGTKTITIDTPAGNSITIDESSTKIEIKDQSNNKITMNSSGISLESPLNIELKAGVNLTLSAGATLSIGAVNLGLKADAAVSMEGAAAKLSSQGVTEITGSLVKIN